MPDNDFNIVKPVESLPNITGLTPANPRQERRRRQTAERKNRSTDNSTNDQSRQTTNDSTTIDKNDEHSIDYRA
jgi:hypothetical protein